MSDKKIDAAAEPDAAELDESDLDGIAGGAAKKSRPPPSGSDPEEGGEFR